MADFSSIWNKLLADTILNPQGPAGELMSALADTLEVEQVEEAHSENYAIFLMNLSRLRFKGMDLNVVMITHTPENADQAREQAKLLEQYKYVQESVGFCFHIILSPEKPEELISHPQFTDIVYICGNDLRRLFGANAPEMIFFEIIQRQVNLERLCPFNTTDVARGSMFVGREKELGSLVEERDNNFLISGARRIGKSSLLIKAKTSLHKNPTFRGRVFYFDCRTWGNYNQCCHEIARQVQPRKERRISLSDQNIKYLLERRTNYGKNPLFLFFDEVDRIVDIDSGRHWMFFNMLKDAALNNLARITFAGYRSVDHLFSDKNSPFFGALKNITLMPLKKTHIDKLFIEVFLSYGIKTHNQNLFLRILYQATGGQVYMAQFYGEKLFELAQKRSARKIFIEDIKLLAEGIEIKRFLETHFRENTIDKEKPVNSERICAFLYAHDTSGNTWAEGDFLEASKQTNHPLIWDDVSPALDNLIKANIFSYRAWKYSFSFPLLKEILKNSFPNLNAILEDSDYRQD